MTIKSAPFDPALASEAGASQIYTDRNGVPIYSELNAAEQWRLPVPLSSISTNVTLATLAIEDKRFFDHRGVDWMAGARAALQNITQRRVVSGASTITMQLARLMYPEPRSLKAKRRQIGRALDLERQRSKEWVLEQYLNHAPYGANIVGIEAASRFYFGKIAKDLGIYEAALLAGIPQRPTALRPDRNPERAGQRRDYALRRMVELKWASAKILDAPPPVQVLPERARPSFTRIGVEIQEPVLVTSVMKRLDPIAHQSTINMSLQELARRILRRRLKTLPDTFHGALVLIDNQTREVLACVGGLGALQTNDNWINGATIPRSPGSTLKPFIYLEAIERGRLIPETKLWDAPLDYVDYRPTNFDPGYSGWIPAKDALALSLNTPAIRLLEENGVESMLSTLQDIGFPNASRPAEEVGLALALGGVDVTLVELTAAYTGLANGGQFAPPKFDLNNKGSPANTRQVYSEEATLLLNRMLRDHPMPGLSEYPICWKTGTSSGFRDAWTVAFNQDITLGVWMGSKSGQTSPDLVGAEAAAPVAADFLRAYYRQRPYPVVQEPANRLTSVSICKTSGRRAGAECSERIQADSIPEAPLLPCRWDHAKERRETDAQSETPQSNAPRIVSPLPRVYHALNGRPPTIRIETDFDGTVSWFLNGKQLREHTPKFERSLAPGTYELSLVPPNGSANETVHFEVR